MVKQKGHKSAGIGDPYWYEWGIGLLKAVEMLNPDSGVGAVAFQRDGVKGWDDVVVRFRSGHVDYYQVKHSRPRTNLTFSDLVGKIDDQSSLLGSLASSWQAMSLDNTNSTCILITNRSAGTNAGRSSGGIYHPPLAEFVSHISDKVKSASVLSDITVPMKWKDAWDEWLDEMRSLSDEEKLQFLKAMRISVDAPQLEEMEAKLTASLSAMLGITERQANTLVKSLVSALPEWTSSIRKTKDWITAEDVMAAMVVSEPEVFGLCDVPTPIPFFLSREQAVADISSLLTRDGKHRIVFLEAEPGFGKTSVVSRIVNQRAEDCSTLVVDIRYYAYRPITPDAPVLPADADRSASPESLWYTLLSQVRERLRGRLLELRVPVRNQFITSDEARDHVLRLAGVLAQEKGFSFVIAIDGIDHAARACRKGLPSLLGSLPSPETVPEGVRLLIAGQPSVAYPEYPIWLKNKNELVVRTALSPIDIADIQLLLSYSTTGIPPENHGHAARIVQGVADGNTLAAVFSVAEAETCETLAKLEARLSGRQLHSGVHAYYAVIWQSAVPNSPAGLGAYLSSVLCILRERITGEMLQDAFPGWKKPEPEWNAILKRLEPLVVRDPDGYRVRHNDIRVFLEQEMRTDQSSMQTVASLLADYYIRPSANPCFRQESLFSLLQMAGREQDKARIFTPNWVLDAAAHGRDLTAIYKEGEDAFRVLPDVKDWTVALFVACAGMTLTKLSDCLDAFPDLLARMRTSQPSLPQCLETERFVLPFNQWDDSTIRQVLNDARMFVDSGEANRARGLIEHWFADISPAKVVSEVKGMVANHSFRDGSSIAMGADSLFKDWGALAFRLGIAVKIEDPFEDIQRQATCLFEKGWASECVKNSKPGSICAALREFNPRYLGTFEVATEEAAKRALWEVVTTLLNVVKEQKDKLPLGFRINAAYWALKAMGQEAATEWIEVLSDARSGRFNENRIEMPLMIFVAKSIGWTEPHRDASAIASELADAITGQGWNVRDRRSLLLPLRAAAMVGLVERMTSKGNIEGAAALVPARAMRDVIELIWEHGHSLDFHEYWVQFLDLTFELIKLCQVIGDAHYRMVLSLAIEKTESFPVDQKMPVLWEVLRRAGRVDRLRAWAEHWIGEEGAAWSGLDYSERADIVGDLSRLCRAEGWGELAKTAEKRLRHHVVGYSNHRECAFQEPFDWIEELFRIDPTTWHTEGIQLLDVCRECDSQGGDNQLSSAIKNEVATAAFRCGPDSAYAFFNWIDPNVERYWLQTVRDTLIAASKRVLTERVVANHTDILALWCCAVGLTRWFDRNQAQTMTALRDTILSSVGPENRQHVADQLQNLTPGEFLREEYDKDRHGSEAPEEKISSMASSDDVASAVAELAQKVKEGHEPSLMEIGRLVVSVARENPVNRSELMRILFGLVDVNRNHVTSWDYREQSHPLKELIPSIKEGEAWELMRAAVRTTGEPYWSRSVSHNVHLICLYRAAAEGVGCLRMGAQSVFAMHRLWAGLPEIQTTNEQQRAAASGVDTWPEFVASILYRLLASDSAETVSSAFRGLSAVAEIAPRAVSALFSGSGGIQRSRLLLGAEVWAVHHPLQFTSVLEQQCRRREDLCLSDRIQLWICSLAASLVEGGFVLPDTFIAQDTIVSETHSNHILANPKRLLNIGPKVQGSVHLANKLSAANNWLSRFGTITGRDTKDIESEIVEGLYTQQANAKVVTNKKEKCFATEDGDMVITHGVDIILDNALDHELCKPEWTDEDAGDVAIAVTHGDDPWIIRRSPLPSPASFDWPNHKEIDEWLDTKADKTNVLNRLRLLARGGDLPANQQVLGSYLRIFTSRHDYEVWYWIEVKRPEEVAVRRATPCPSGRSFQLFLPKRFEPRTPDHAPLVLFSRSFLCLSFSNLEIIPSSVLQNQLGWYPSPRNPLEWEREGRLVAKYETYHGPLDYNWGQLHMKQSTLSRWVVNSDDLKKLGCLTPLWDHQSYQAPNE